MFKTHLLLRLAVAAVAIVAAGAAWGQSSTTSDLVGGTGINFGGGDEGDLDVSAAITKPARGEPAQLVITAEIPDGWHTFSITQQAGGPLKTKIKLDPSKDFKLAGDFKADPAPKVSKSAAYGDLPIETHEGRVTWTAPIELAAGVDAATLKVTGALSSQRCLGEDKCLPPKSFKFTAAVEEATKKEEADGRVPVGDKSASASAVSRTDAASAAAAPFTPTGTHVTLRGWIEPAVVAPGSIAKLVLSAEPNNGYHVYAFADRDPKAVGIGKPTLIVLTDTSGFRYAPPEASTKPLEKPAEGASGTIRYHESPVRWTMPIEIPPATKPGEYPIRGLIGVHTCNDAIGCDLPQGAEFRTRVIVGSADARGIGAEARFSPATYRQVATIAERNAAAQKPDNAVAAASRDSAQPAVATVPSRPKEEPLGLPAVIAFSLLGGFILNFMPCVLPVIGLKILSFVEQGGRSRAHVLGLNLCYTLGLMAVFMGLAALNAFAGLAWGERSTGFNIGLTCIVFVMALSFLGVWEIPIPGFVGSGKGVELAAREGAAGAFAKGVLTTILATPCSGPFLGAVFAFGARQPVYIVFLVYAMIGLGMALPYLVIGAFPRLIRFLPKPGAWMDTFKQFMGFVLLGTVVYLFWTLNTTSFLVPTFALMVGLWFACWWIGRTPLFASIRRKLAAWAVGALVAAAIGVFAFLFLTPVLLDGVPYTKERLNTLAASGKTVLLDFTANWCLTCQLNSRLVIDTEDVSNAIKANNAVLMIADWSDYGPEIKEALLNLTGGQSLPVLVVFPAGRANEPIILRDVLTKRRLIDTLEQASASRKQNETAANPTDQKAPGVVSFR